MGQLVTLEWRVDYLISSSSLSDLNVPTVQLQVTTAQDKARDQLAFEVSADKLRVLLSGKCCVVAEGFNLTRVIQSCRRPKR